jgi:hypothetical protein
MATVMSARFSVLLLPLMLGCQEIDGACPEVESVTPASSDAEATEPVVVEGRSFALGHEGLWDEGPASPPEVWFDVSLEDSVPEELLTPEDQAALAAMGEMSLEADRVVYVSSSRLDVTLPDVSWSDIESGASMYGMDMEIPDFITEMALVTRVRVVNPTGCEATWSEDFSLILAIPQEGQ